MPVLEDKWVLSNNVGILFFYGTKLRRYVPRRCGVPIASRQRFVRCLEKQRLLHESTVCRVYEDQLFPHLCMYKLMAEELGFSGMRVKVCLLQVFP
jgi:hypothetical protein